MGYARSRELYKAKGRPWIPFEDNYGLQQLIAAVAEQTDQTLQNITQSLGFAVRMPSGQLAFQPIAEYYQRTLDAAMLDISSGAFDYNTVLKRTVKEMTNSGLRTVDYASGHSNRVEVAARRAIMTGLTQLTDKVTEDTARELETDMWEITWHSGARPTHWWGGRWYNSADLVKVCGYGTVTGLCGANCYHQKFPVIPGISESTYTQEELDKLNAAEQKPREFGGKTYTKYEALQHQRRMETTMRAQRQEIRLLQDGGAKEEDITAARARYRGTSAEYARFSEAVDLPQQRERVTVDGLGNIGQGKYTGGSDRPAMKQRVGSKITGTVSDQERAELLGYPRVKADLTSVNFNSSSIDNSTESGIIESKSRDWKSAYGNGETIDTALFGQALAAGEINTTIFSRDQQNHVTGSAWKNQVKQAIMGNGKPKSRLYKSVDPQSIVDNYAGTGIMVSNKGNQAVDEFISMPNVVGVTYDKKQGKYVETHRLQIKYTRNGTHVFPVIEGGKKQNGA